MLPPGRTSIEESSFIAMNNISNLSRKEFVNRLRGQSRSQLVETCLELHSQLNSKTFGTLRIPVGTAIGMASLASPAERRKLKKGSPDLFERKASAKEVDAGKAAVISLYRQIDMTEPGAPQRRIAFRSKFPDVFK